ncbi:MAG: hypothetical protein N3H31_05985 [Candidatus Nezhaarchaeota archaeon]|nr:hypothetical protein [Candidatus Nezhaarchaeota archaeon]
MAEGFYGHELISGCDESPKCYESMEEHLKGVKLTFDYLFQHYGRYVHAKALREGGHRGLCPQLHYVVLALHDVGKAIYQDSLRSRCKAPLHEAASAAIAFCVCDEALCDNCRLAAVLSILLHHHAMRPPSELMSRLISLSDELKKRVKSEGAYIDRCIDIANRVFGLSLKGRGLDKYLERLETVKTVLKNLIGLMSNAQLRTPPPLLEALKTYRLALALLQPLIVCDITSASIQRRPPCRSLEPSDLDAGRRLKPLVREVVEDARRRRLLSLALRGRVRELSEQSPSIDAGLR